MKKFTDQEYLKTQQYKNASNLNARIQLHHRFSTTKQGLFSWLFNHLDLPASSRILELGCGSGEFWLENLAHIPGGWAITLSDLSDGMLQEARENLAAIEHQIEYKLIDAQEIPYDDGYFDAVMANFMLYHVPDRCRAISEIRRILKPGGRLYAVTNGINHMRETRELVVSLDPGADLAGVGGLFGLENGHEQLAGYFSEVALHRYEDGLVVTDVEPLVAYIACLKRFDFTEAGPQRLAGIIQREIKEKGAFTITKDSGLFIATKTGRC